MNALKPISVLVFAPTPTHPAIQGNRQRALDMCRAMHSMGADLTFLYYAVDGLDADATRRMKNAWHNLEVVFPRGFAPGHTLVRSPSIDDWFDPEIASSAGSLGDGRRFDVCFVNYVWYSRIFESLPTDIVRVIDTHDVFGGRLEHFAQLDLDTEWFHTSIGQEAIGLDRADFVIAIQDAEAETLQARTMAHVDTVGFLSAPNVLPAPAPAPSGRLRAGYLGSGNPFNVASISSLGHALQRRPETADKIELHVAGQVCTALAGTVHPFNIRGVVDSVADFYRTIDVVVNPMAGGTGLKIKSLEAISFGKPLLATADAMVGIKSGHDGHLMDGPDAMVQRLLDISENPGVLAAEAEISRTVFDAYRREQLREFSGLWSRIEDEVRARRRARGDSPRGEAA